MLVHFAFGYQERCVKPWFALVKDLVDKEILKPK